MQNTDSSRRVLFSTADIAKGALVVLAIYAVARLLLSINSLVFVTFLGVLFGLAVSAGTDHLQRLKIPRAVGAVGIVLGFLGLLIGFGIWTGPTVQEQYRELRERLPQAVVEIDRWIASQRGSTVGRFLISKQLNDEEEAEAEKKATAREAAEALAVEKAARAPAISPDAQSDRSTTEPQIEPPGSQEEDLGGVTTQPAPLAPPLDIDSLTYIKSLGTTAAGWLSGITHYAYQVISSTLAAITGAFIIIFLAIYVAVEPSVYKRGILALVPVARRPRWEQVLTASSTALKRWLITQLIAMLVIGVATTIVLFLLDVPAALPLGILAGLLEFIPTIGPILSAVPSIAMGFTVSPEKALVVTIAYIVIQFVENNFLIPILMKEGVDLPPVLTIVTQAVMAFVFGFMGLFVAVPLLVLVTVFVKMLYVEDVIEKGVIESD